MPIVCGEYCLQVIQGKCVYPGIGRDNEVAVESKLSCKGIRKRREYQRANEGDPDEFVSGWEQRSGDLCHGKTCTAPGIEPAQNVDDSREPFSLEKTACDGAAIAALTVDCKQVCGVELRK